MLVALASFTEVTVGVLPRAPVYASRRVLPRGTPQGQQKLHYPPSQAKILSLLLLSLQPRGSNMGAMQEEIR
ncbi:hypothetical protein RHGRI_001863 [Rhododendron griersonianum]|uniref:Uncharacterized protein n=1 Tax=Rhododendron griersonianum TaxID=479676 RepID=A0AAV6LPR9_9ERIC|nr:hypothetical protein RHGRI_001863 [Rhododendron griersonianum]